MTFSKFSITASLLAAAVTLSACDNSDESGDDDDGIFSEGMYGPEEGMIKYVIDGGMQKGTKTVYWRRNGLEEATYEDTEVSPIPGFSQKTSTWTIRTPETMVNIDRLTNRALTMNNPAQDMFSGMSRKDMDKMAEQMGENFQRTEQGTRDIAGETCTVFTMQAGPGMQITTCEWEGLFLSNAVMGRQETAVEIKIGSVSDEHFTVPENLNVEQAPDISEIMKQLNPGQGQQN